MIKKLISILLVIAMAAGCYACASDSGELTETAAIRQFEELPDGIVYISDEYVALAGTPIDNTMGQNTLNRINTYRNSQNVGRMNWSNELAYAATIRAQEAFSVWSHSRPDGTDYWTVNSAIVYGENLSKGYSSPDTITAAWEASPSHNDNLLYASYKTCGIGFFTAPDGTLYCACEFGY